MKNLKLIVAASLLLVSALALALDSPHDASWSTSVTECASCHQLHGSAGGTLTKFPSNNDACLTCHDTLSPTPNHFFSPAWSPSGTQATPGTGGSQHNWSSAATGRGARVPVNNEMAIRLDGGQLRCAVCHDEHGVKDSFGMPVQNAFAPKSAHASYKFMDARPPITGTGTMMLVSIDAASTWSPPAGMATYLVEVAAYNPGTGAGTLRVSHDGGTAWVSGMPFTKNVDAELDDPNVVVRFTSDTTVGSRWQFYVGYPFLRATNVADAMCLDCHAGRHQSYRCVQGDPAVTDGAGVSCAADGVRTFSHPVREALSANGASVDLAAPLDADGSSVSSANDGDGDVPNPGNDLVLQDGLVGCTTCHAPHNADSNSYTVDVR